MSENKESQLLLPVLHRGAAHPLARWKDSKSIRMMANRLVDLDKDPAGLTFNEGLLIAQASLAKGLSPFPPRKEIHYWIDTDKDGNRQLTIVDAAVGVIRLSEEAARRDGTYLEDPDYRQIVDPNEKVGLGFEADDLVVECKARDYRSVQNYYNRRSTLKDEGLSSKEIDERLGTEPPALVGHGAMSKNEMDSIDWGYNRQEKKRYRKRNTYPHINRTKKRAYTASLTQRWATLVDVQALQEAASALPDDAFLIEGEWREIEVEDFETRVEKGASALYGVECPACGGMLQDPIPNDCPHCGAKDIKYAIKKDKPKETPKEKPRASKQKEPRLESQWESEIIDKIVDLGLVQAKPHAINILNKSLFVNVPYGELEMIEAVAYFVAWEGLKQELPTMKTDERADALNKAFELGNNDDAIEKAIELLGG